MDRRIERGLAVAATICAAVLLVVAAAVTGISPLQSASETDQSGTENVTSDQLSANASEPVIRHRDPETIETSTVALDRTGLELAQSLGVRLNVSASELREENFTAAEAQLGAEYQEDVIRLTDIAEATDNASDDEIAEAYRRASTEQREAIGDAEEFQELYTEYQQARASQNETEAREAAQRLAEKYEEINASATELKDVYSDLEQVNESQARRAQQQINQSLARASQITQATRESTYIETTLTVEAIRQAGSPTQPFVLRGQLRTVEGEPLANRTVVLESAVHTTQVQTNETGAFIVRHRPTVLTQGAQSVNVRYVPNATAGYLGTTAAANVQIVQAESTVELNTTPATVANGTPSRITGRVLVDTEGVEAVPVQLQVDGRVVATGRTDADGAFTLVADPPLSTPAGTTTASVAVATTNQAVAPSQQTTAISIEEIPTTVSLSIERVQSQIVGVSGTLSRESGESVASQTVAISAGGQQLGWFQTDENGRFGGNVTLPETQSGVDSTTLTLTATFDGGTTHLATAQTTTSVPPLSTESSGVFGYGVSAQVWSLLLGAIMLLGGAVILTRRRRTAEDSTTDSGTQRARPDPDPPEPSAAYTPERDPPELLQTAQQVGTDTPRDATRLAYLAVRTKMAREATLGEHDSLTHWEFYDACQANDAEWPPDYDTKFKQLTELYEQAIYTEQPLPGEQLDALLQYFTAEVVPDG